VEKVKPLPKERNDAVCATEETSTVNKILPSLSDLKKRNLQLFQNFLKTTLKQKTLFKQKKKKKRRQIKEALVEEQKAKTLQSLASKILPDIIVDVVSGKDNAVIDNFHTPNIQSRRLTPRRPLSDLDLGSFKSTTVVYQMKPEKVSDTIE
jgi:hypothetical protein